MIPKSSTPAVLVARITDLIERARKVECPTGLAMLERALERVQIRGLKDTEYRDQLVAILIDLTRARDAYRESGKPGIADVIIAIFCASFRKHNLH